MFTWFLLGRRAAASLPPQVHSHHLITRLDFQKLQPWPRFTCALMTTLCVCTSLLYFLVCLWRVKIVEWCWLIKKNKKKLLWSSSGRRSYNYAAEGGGFWQLSQRGDKNTDSDAAKVQSSLRDWHHKVRAETRKTLSCIASVRTLHFAFRDGKWMGQGGGEEERF